MSFGKGLTSTLHNILSKPLAAFPHTHCRNDGKRWERGISPVAMTIINPRKESWPSWGSNQRPPVLKSTRTTLSNKWLNYHGEWSFGLQKIQNQREASTHVSLRGKRRLKWVGTFRKCIKPFTEQRSYYTEPQKKRRTKKYYSQFSLHLYNEIVHMCNDKILVQR